MGISVLTLVKGRREHLINMIHGLNQQDVQPDELVIGYMGEAPYSGLPNTGFPIHIITITDAGLPLAKARNAVARAAKHETLVFLDVDCIPAPTCLSGYRAGLDQQDGVMMGEVRYLPKGAVSLPMNWDALDAVSVHHSERPAPPEEGIAVCHEFRCFWSLSFAMRRNNFMSTGGFDEDYTGYGAEDTDYGQVVQQSGLTLYWCANATAYHQYHSHHMPPVHHLESVLHNNRVYKQKWGGNTMEHWFKAFCLMGLIEPYQGDFRMIRQPNAQDFDITSQRSDMPYASTNEFLTWFHSTQLKAS